MRPRPNQKRLKRGERVWPDPAPDSFENVVKAVVTVPKRKEHEWKYLQRERASRQSPISNRNQVGFG